MARGRRECAGARAPRGRRERGPQRPRLGLGRRRARTRPGLHDGHTQCRTILKIVVLLTHGILSLRGAGTRADGGRRTEGEQFERTAFQRVQKIKIKIKIKISIGVRLFLWGGGGPPRRRPTARARGPAAPPSLLPVNLSARPPDPPPRPRRPDALERTQQARARSPGRPPTPRRPRWRAPRSRRTT